MRRVSLLLVTMLVFLPVLHAESALDAKLSALKSAMMNELRGRRNPQMADQYPPAPALAGNGVPGFGYLNRLARSEHGERLFDDPKEVINKILSEYSGAATQKAGQEALQALDDQRLAALTADQHKFQSDLDQLKTLIDTATQPADFDRLLGNLGHFQSRDKEGTISPEVQRIVLADTAARDCAISWQAYLFHKAHGDAKEALQDLSFIAKESGRADAAFQAEIAGNVTAAQNSLPPPHGVAEVIAGLSELEEMEPALKTIRILNTMRGFVDDADNTHILHEYVVIYRCLRDGLPEPLIANIASLASSFPNHDLSDKMLRFATLHYLAAFHGAPLAKDEALPAFVNRVISDAVEREDWTMFGKALEVQEYLAKNGTTGTVESTGYLAESLLSAVHLDNAGQYHLAVISYEAALKTGNPYLPREFIEDRLSKIQSDRQDPQVETSHSN